ncbi:MAG TPA: S8 family serine peptidase [Chryseosolibacter sp.]
MKFTTVAILVICYVVCCNAQKHVQTDLVQIITTLSARPNAVHYLKRDSSFLLVKLKQDRSVSDLIHAGLRPIRVLDNQLIVIKPSTTHATLHHEIIESSKPVNYLWKLSDNLLTLDFEQSARYVVQAENPGGLLSSIRKFDLETELQNNLVIIRGNIEPALSSILADSNVTYVGKESLQAQEEGRVLELYHAPNKTNRVHHEYPDLNGEGIVISIKERQFNPADIDLLGRSIASALADDDTSNHATEMATIMAGAGNSFITGRGVAAHARLTTSSFDNLFPDNGSHFSSTNAFLQNHAYGTVVENFYGALANAYDAAINENPKVLHVFSSGNSGTSLAASGKYVNAPGYSNLTGNSKMAKNALVVGAVDTTGNAVSFSSRGPAHDGRIKPELVAYSTAGTSNAAALVSGIAAMLQQTYKSMKAEYPDAALLKAVLINAADDAGPAGIDFITGFGNVNAYRSVKTLMADHYFEGTIRQGEVLSFAIAIPENVINLKATLVWNDPAAPVNSTTALVNNLDLDLMSSGEIMQPWILDPSPTVSALSASPRGGIDNLNNVEQVSVERPSPQTYHIEVRGISIIGPGQKFFVAYQWDEEETFTWNYPTGSDNFPYNGETGTYFYWKSTLAAQRGNLEVTLNDGATWTSVATNVELEKGYFRWEQPFAGNALARARMVVGAKTFETEAFTISRALLPSVAFNCADSVLLQWNLLPEVSGYEVQQLTGNYTSAFTSLPDTTLIIQKNSGAEYFSIQPVLPGGRRLLRSPAVNINTYGAGCYISTFVDETVADDGIVLRLEVGTTYGIRAIDIEHAPQGSEEFTTITMFSNPTANTIRFLHAEPSQGLNQYRARIHFTNGQNVVSDTIQVYFLTKTPFIVFPNPVNVSGELNIFSAKAESPGFQFQLYKNDGTWIRSSVLTSDRESVSMEGLPPGLYLYRIEGAAERFSGKILVR